MEIAWIIFIIFLIAVIQSSIYKKWALRKVGYQRFFSERAVFQGDRIQMVEQIFNNKFLPVPWLRLESMIHGSLQFQHQFNLNISGGEMYQNHRSLFTLMSYMRITRRHSITCTKRGCYYLNSATMTSGDAFGIQQVTKQIALHSELIVYPQTVPIEDIPLPSHSWQGDVTVRRWIVEDPFIIAGVREYRYGDAMKNVNWKATARTGRLQVHNNDYTADHRLMIYINFDVTETMWDAVTNVELIEKGISYAATIAQKSILQGVETGFGCNGYEIDKPKQPVRKQPHCSDEHAVSLLETMAKLVVARSCDFPTFLQDDVARAQTNTDYLIITAFVSEKMEALIGQIRANGNAVDIVPLIEDEIAYAEQVIGASGGHSDGSSAGQTAGQPPERTAGQSIGAKEATG